MINRQGRLFESCSCKDTHVISKHAQSSTIRWSRWDHRHKGTCSYLVFDETLRNELPCSRNSCIASWDTLELLNDSRAGSTCLSRKLDSTDCTTWILVRSGRGGNWMCNISELGQWLSAVQKWKNQLMWSSRDWLCDVQFCLLNNCHNRDTEYTAQSLKKILSSMEEAASNHSGEVDREKVELSLSVPDTHPQMGQEVQVQCLGLDTAVRFVAHPVESKMSGSSRLKMMDEFRGFIKVDRHEAVNIGDLVEKIGGAPCCRVQV